MHIDQIKAAYNASAHAYAEKCFNELDYKPLDRELLDRFAGLTKGRGMVYDIGCGPGQTTRHLFLMGSTVTGIDIGEEMVLQAEKLNPEISFLVDDMFGLKAADATLAGISAFYAIVNFTYPDIVKIIAEFNRVLQNDGLLLMAFHVEEKEIHVDDFFGGGKPLDFYYFDENKIIDILKNSGFKILEALVRLPYEEEYPSKRAYVIARKQRQLTSNH